MPFYNWSHLASTNATADAAINWAEGQLPSTVNDSARAMMASISAYRDDTAGSIITTGSATAYVVASFQAFDTLAHLSGQSIAFVPHATNTNTVGADVTLNVDGLGAKAIRMAPSIALPNGTLILGTPYVVTYNFTDGVFYLQGMTNPYSIPLGSGIDYWGTVAPNSCFAFASGQELSRTTYATVFSIMSTAYGVGNGSTTFNLPDKRGRVSAGADNMNGVAASRLTSFSGMGTGVIAQAGGSESHQLTAAEMPSHTHTGTTGAMSTNAIHSHTTGTLNGITYSGGAGVGQGYQSTGSATGNANVDHTHSFTSDAAGSSSSHPIVQPTICCNYIIRII